MIYVYAMALYEDLIREEDIPIGYREKSMELYDKFKREGKISI